MCDVRLNFLACVLRAWYLFLAFMILTLVIVI